MMKSRLHRFILLAIVFCSCAVCLFFTQNHLDALKAEKGLVNMHTSERMTPRMAITVGALGAFRGLIADLLFLRMTAEKEKGNYFELMQLGDLIIQLQPDMPGAINFIAWNMAYNISVTFNRPEDRWRWVQRGIEIIRDEALVYNPDDPEVYHQLAWIYQHKVGQTLDDANRYYKGQLALQMIHVLGDKQEYDWDRLAGAADTEDDLRVMLGRRLLARTILKQPDAPMTQLDKSLQSLARQVRDKGRLPTVWHRRFVEVDIPAEMQQFLESYKAEEQDSAARQKRLRRLLLRLGVKTDFYKMLVRRNTTFRRFETEFRQLSDFPPGLREELEALDLAEDIDFFFRSRWLRDEYKLDADTIVELNQEFGYLDFRLPEAHAIYWARQGLQYSPNHPNLNRIVTQSSAKSVKWGRLRYVTKDGYAVVMPNLDNIDKVKEIQLQGLAKFDYQTGFVSGFENWVKDTVIVLWSWGRNEKAKEYLKFLRDYERFGNNRDYNLPLEDFALKLAAEDIKDQSAKQISGIVFGLGIQYIQALAFDEPDRAALALSKLKRIRKRYYADISNPRREERKRLPSVEQIVLSAKAYLLQMEPHPEIQQRIWNAGPDLTTPQNGVREGDPAIQQN